MTAPVAAETADKARVLVVDDSRVMRKAINKILKDDGLITEAEDGEEAWEKLVADASIQVLITDIEMPRLDGYQLICRIRASEEPRIRNLPIITITGAEDEETKTRAFACGATDFIVKPLDKVQLQARVRAHAKLDETTRQLDEVTATLEEEATTDPLTGLVSRRYFLQRGEQDLAHATRHNTPLSIMRIDIDHFKPLYRQHGDEAADHMLVHVAGCLAATARTEDTVARIGGAEFAIIAPATTKTEAAILAERLRNAVSGQAFAHDGVKEKLTVSIGVVTNDDAPGKFLDELLALANERLRNAKAEGGDCVSVVMRSEAIPRLEEVTLTAPAAGSDTPAPPKAPEEAAGAAETPGPRALPAELVDIGRALEMLANGDADKVSAYVLDLARRVLPLLEYCDKKHVLGLANEIDSIKEKVYSAK